MQKPSLEDPEIEYFAHWSGDIDFDRLFELAWNVGDPSLQDIEVESFAKVEDDKYFDEVIELVKAIFDPIYEILPECGETTELPFPTIYSLVFEPSDLISESKWVGPIHMWPRWPSLTMGRKKDNEWFYTRVQTRWQGCNDSIKMKAHARNDHFPPPFFDHLMKWLAGYFFMLIDYPSYDHYLFDPGKSRVWLKTLN